MPDTIILKNAAAANVTYSVASRVGNVRTFVRAGTSLLDRSKLTLQLREGGNTNRVVGKLSIPTIGTNLQGQPSVVWTEVGSFDLSAVLIATDAQALDFFAQFASLAGHDVVKSMFTSGVQA